MNTALNTHLNALHADLLSETAHDLADITRRVNEAVQLANPGVQPTSRTYSLRTTPLDLAEMIDQQAQNEEISGVYAIGPGVMNTAGENEDGQDGVRFTQRLIRLLTGGNALTRIGYKILGFDPGTSLLHVKLYADATPILQGPGQVVYTADRGDQTLIAQFYGAPDIAADVRLLELAENGLTGWQALDVYSVSAQEAFKAAQREAQGSPEGSNNFDAVFAGGYVARISPDDAPVDTWLTDLPADQSDPVTEQLSPEHAELLLSYSGTQAARHGVHLTPEKLAEDAARFMKEGWDAAARIAAENRAFFFGEDNLWEQGS